jgi:hypothetical protein
MVITVLAAYLVGSRSAKKRAVGFWVFLASNVAWIVWGFHAEAYALIVLQFALAAINIRGAHRNEKADKDATARSPSPS